MKKNYLKFVCLMTAMMMAVTFVACENGDSDPSQKDNEKPINPETPDADKAITPAAQKEYLETVALELMNKIPAAEFEALADLGLYIGETYEDYDWDDVGDWASDTFEGLRTALGTTTEKHEYYNNIYNNYSAVLMASNFTGHFTAGNRRWNYEKANDLQFIFTDEDDNRCVLSLVTSGSVKKVYAFNYDDWTDYDYDKGVYNEYYDRTQCTIGVPEKIVVSLTQGNKKVINTTININLSNITNERFDISKSSLTMSIVTELNNGYAIKVNNVAYSANKNAQVSTAIEKNGSSLISLGFYGDVNNIPSVNVDAFSSDFDMDDYDTDRTNAKNAFVKFDVLGKVQIQGTLSDVRKFADYIDEAYEYDENEAKFKSYLNQANSLADVNLFYDGSAVKQATVVLEAFEEDSWYGERYWDMEPVIKFYDGSSYSTLEAFFNERDFKTVIDTFKRLADKYAELVDEDIDW